MEANRKREKERKRKRKRKRQTLWFNDQLWQEGRILSSLKDIYLSLGEFFQMVKKPWQLLLGISWFFVHNSSSLLHWIR